MINKKILLSVVIITALSVSVGCSSGDYSQDESYEQEDNDEEYVEDESFEENSDHDTHWVDDYTRRDGTEVEGHERSNPDDDLTNNLNQ